MGKKRGFLLFLCIAISIGLTCFSCTREKPLKRVMVVINGWTITAEVADTLPAQEKGLMYRKHMDNDRGMLFVYTSDAKRSFWMKNTTIPLSIAYIAADGTIREIYDMEPLSTRTIDSKYSVRYALEVNQGTFEQNGIKVGDKADFIEP